MSNPRLDQRLATLASKQTVVSPSYAVSERRDSDRESAYKFGIIHLPSGEKIQCIIQNLSSSGARIKLSGTREMPSGTRLTIDGMRFDKAVEVRWQKNDEAGLTY